MDRLEGVCNMPVTPFTDSGEFDEQSMRRQIDHAIDDGVSCLIAIGRVGEVMYLTMEERAKVVDVVIEQVDGRLPVGVGCIDPTFDEGLAMGRLARDGGADFIMSRGPVDGDILDYFRKLADTMPVMMYDVGAQRDLTMKEDVAPIVQETGNVVGVKISGNQEQVLEAKELMDVPILCGREAMLMLSYELGADGVSSVLGVLRPSLAVGLYRDAKAGRWDEARDAYYEFHLPLANYLPGGPGLMGWSINKHILFWEGIIDSPYVRPPSLPASEVRLEVARRLWEQTKTPA